MVSKADKVLEQGSTDRYQSEILINLLVLVRSEVLKLLMVLARSVARARTEPLYPGRISFGPWIPTLEDSIRIQFLPWELFAI